MTTLVFRGRSLRACTGALVAALSVALATGCSSVPSTVPDAPNPNLSLVDTYRVDATRYDRDYRECAALANQSDTSRSWLKSALAGAVVGAVIGSAYGKANLGGTIGAVSMGAAASADLERKKQGTLRMCLGDRGYALIR